MLFKETGNVNLPTIILLHGGGYSNWSLAAVAQLLKADFHVVTPIIDGHGEDGLYRPFISISASADNLLAYIDQNYDGHVFALGGLSLGAQIVTEVLAKRPAITYYAIIESALVYPIKKLTDLSLPIYKMSYGLLNKRWFSKAQFKMSFLPMSFFEQYYQDSVRMSKESLVNMLISNGNYDLPQTIRETTAKVLIIAGDQELKVMIKSAQRLHQTIAGSELYLAEHMRHGELSLGHPQQFVEILKSFFE